jgi:hypothetical protein
VGPAVARTFNDEPATMSVSVRYAILFSGMTSRRHLNGLEFCYRTLVEHFGFEPANIEVLSYDGTLRTVDAPPQERPDALWPGNGTPHRLQVSGTGSREAFVAALGRLKHKLQADDLLFVNTVGHGGNYADGRGPQLVVHPFRDRYPVREFCSDLSELPPHRALLVLMSQCYAGGFRQPIVAASPAKMTFIASASHELGFSHAMSDDGNWDSFQRNWLAGVSGRDVDGSRLAHHPPGDRNVRVSVRDAFDYANDPRVRHADDTPEFAASPECAGDMSLWAEVALTPGNAVTPEVAVAPEAAAA